MCALWPTPMAASDQEIGQLRAIAEIADPDERRRALQASGFADDHALLSVVDLITTMMASAPSAAEALAEVCAAIGEEAGAFSVVADAQYLRARIVANRGEPTEALALIDSARQAYVRAGRGLEALRTDLGRMHVLDDFGRHYEAIETGERALGILDTRDVATDDEEFAAWISAAIHENLGVAFGFTQGHQRALDSYSAAEDVYQRLGLAADLARVRANRGVELIDAGHAAAALDVLAEAATRFDDEGDLLWNAKCLGHQADAYMLLGNYVDALDLLERARRLLDDIGAVAEATRLASSLANVSLALSLHKEALDLSLRAAETFRDADMVHDLAVALQRCGIAAVRTGLTEPASVYLTEAEAHFEQVGAVASAAETSLLRAEVLDSLGQRADARALTTAAVDRLADAESPAYLALALLQLSDLSDPTEAWGHLERASAIIGDLDLPPLKHPLELRLGRWYRRNGDLERAVGHMRTAVEIIDALQGMVPGESLRAVFLGDKREAVDELAEALLSAPIPDARGAFTLCERARSRTLHELMSATTPAVRELDSPPTEFILAGRELNAIYNTLVGLGTAGSTERRDVLLQRASALEREMTVLRMRESGAPREPRPVAPGSSLDSPVTSITYEVLQGSVHAFVLRDHQLEHRRLDTSAGDIEAALNELDRQHAYFRFGPEFAQRNSEMMQVTTTAILQEIYGRILAPIEDLFPANELPARLVVVPSSVLHRVPFHALHTGRSFVVAHTACTLAPSTSIAANSVDIVATSAPDQRPVLVMGISDPTIPSAAAEAAEIASMFDDAQLFLNDRATIERFRQVAPSAQVIHLACHGIHRAENPLFSSLRLADGWITAAEIMKLRLTGATVVLSACESGRHGASAGEALGLTWAFLAAGATAVVVSLWAVHDSATASLMAGFYRHLRAGLGHAIALQRAQVESAEQWPHPYHWAPFVLVGPFSPPSQWRSP